MIVALDSLRFFNIYLSPSQYAIELPQNKGHKNPHVHS